MAFTFATNPAIDGMAAQRILAPVIMRNVVQKVQLSDGKGVTQEFSTDTSGLEIRIIRQTPLSQKARKLGAGTDGKHFSAQSYEIPQSAEYGIKPDIVWDTPIDIPRVMTDMLPLDVLNANARNIDQAVAKNINASTLAAQLAAALNYHYNDGTTAVTTHVVEHTLGTDSFLDSFFTLSAVLDNGDTDNGVDAFAITGRAIQLRPSVLADMRKSGQAVFDLGNWKGQDMLKVGAIEPEVTPNTHEDGYLGEINQTAFFVTANAIWTLAEEYLGLDAGDLDGVYAVLSAAEGTGRAIAFGNSVQVIPSPIGQGVRLLPLYRWGHNVFFPKSVAMLVEDSFAAVGDGALEVVAPGSQA